MRTAKSSVLRKTILALVAGLLLAQHGGGVRASDTETAGDVLRVAIPAAAFALTLKRDDREGRRQFYKSFGASVAGTWALKETVDKKRPDGTGDDAFPSGHAATAFQGAAFIHRRYGIRGAWPAYVLAGYTAWTRVDADEHDTADVLAGAAVGIASSFVLAKRRNVNVSALVERDTVGLRISGRF
jgi:membrane-associated phospholipid phosphatase